MGRLSGFYLEKSQGDIDEQTAVSMTDENGVTNASGSISSASSGKVNTITMASGTDNPQSGTTISINLFDMTGAEYDESYSGMFLMDSAGSTNAAGSGGFSQKVDGLSLSTMSMTRVGPVSYLSASSSESTKYLATANGSGTALMKDDVVLSESGSYRSKQIARVESNQSVTAFSSFSEGFTSGNSLLSFSTNAKFQMEGDEAVSWIGVADAAHSNGGASSKLGGSVKTTGSMLATVNTERTESNDLSENVTLSATFSGGGSMDDRVGAVFIGEIAVIHASGGESSYDKSASSMSISQTRDGSSKEQSVTSISSSSEELSYTLSLLQFGDIVGSESGTVSLSSGRQDVTHISSSGSSKGSNFYGWESRSATISSNDSFSAYGTFHGLTGSNGGAGDSGDDSNGTILWSISSGTSIVGTMTTGNMFQYGDDGTANGQATTIEGFSR